MVVLGTVLLPQLPAALTPLGPRHVLVALQPDGRMVEARVAHLGQGLGKGVFAPPLPGDEVVVFLPDGDPLGAVVLGALANARAPTPLAAVAGINVLAMHPGGVELRTVDGLPANGIVMGTLLPDLLAAMQALLIFAAALQTVTTPATLSAIAPAATSFVTNPSVIAFVASLTASSVPTASVPPGIGGLPYASPLNKVTA